MKIYNFEEMKEKFGVCYTYSTNFNQEDTVIISQVFKGVENFNGRGFYDTKEGAFEAYKKTRKAEVEQSMKNLESLLSKMSFFSKLFNKTNIEKARREIEEWEKKKSFPIKIEHVLLDTDNLYKVTVPELKLNDKVYVAVTSKNIVDENVYEQNVDEVNYYLNLNKEPSENIIKDGKEVKVFDLIIGYQVSAEDKSLSNRLTKKMEIEEDTEFHNGYTYHSTFLKKENAVLYFNRKMREKIDFYESKIIK